jgi:type III pantothenate kinase
MLLFDAGNSRCKWAWVENGRWLHEGVFRNTDEVEWRKLKDTFSRLAAPQKILVSNVAGAAMEQNLREVCAAWDVPLEIVVAQAEQCGVYNAYEQAAQLGSDRWAALIAAWNREHRACLVINCGTATTVDALSDRGEFLGGLILPGMELMLRSLLNNTAQLGVENGGLRNFPRNTADAVVSGVIRASTGAIRYQYNLLASQGSAHCIVSGGAVSALLPHLDMEAEQVDNLVLHGLQIIGQS